MRIPSRNPNLNAYVERFIRSITFEALNRMAFFGENSLRRAVVTYFEHYHAEWIHQGLRNQLVEPEPEDIAIAGEIKCRQRLGGMLRSDHRSAA